MSAIQQITYNGIEMYALGNTSLLDCRTKISVAGTRHIDQQSKLWLTDLLYKQRNNKEVPVISGLAIGTDKIAHDACIEFGIPCIGIVPSGLNNIYPKKNMYLARKILKNNGLLLSICEPEQGIKNNSQYHDRNELIARFGTVLIVPQFDIESGTMSTVKKARKYDKLIIVQDKDYPGNQHILNDNSFKTLAK